MFERSSVEWFYFDVADLNVINFWSCWFRQLICRFCIQLTASSPIQLNLRHKIASVAGHKTKYEHSFEWFNDAAWFVKGIKLYHYITAHWPHSYSHSGYTLLSFFIRTIPIFLIDDLMITFLLVIIYHEHPILACNCWIVHKSYLVILDICLSFGFAVSYLDQDTIMLLSALHHAYSGDQEKIVVMLNVANESIEVRNGASFTVYPFYTTFSFVSKKKKRSLIPLGMEIQCALQCPCKSH